MGIVFGQDNQFRAAKVPTAVTPYQGVETVPVINVAPKSSALDHFYAFEKNFQRTFDIFSKAIENKGYSVLDELEAKKNQDIIDGFTTEQVAARNLDRYKDVAKRGVIPTRTEAHKEFAKRHAAATGLNVEAIASARVDEFQEYVRNNPTDEGGIMQRYDDLEQEWGGGQVWDILEGEVRPVIDSINRNNQSRSLAAAQERLKIGVQQRIEEQLDAAPGTPKYLEGLRQLFGDTGIVPDSRGNYDLLAIGGSFYEVYVAPAIKEMNESGPLDSWTYDALMDTLDEAIVPIAQEAQKIIQTADRAAINAQRLESKTLSLQAAIDLGKDISAEAGSLLSEIPQIDSKGKFIPWSDRFASLVKAELDKPHLTNIPKTEGRTLEEVEVNRIDRLNRYHALTTIVPEDITTFMEDYGDVALRSVSPTYSEFVAAGLDKDTDSDIFQDILPDINREYSQFRKGALDQVKAKLAQPVLSTVESLLNASEGKNSGNPQALKRYFDENIAPILMDYFPDEIETINGLFNYDDNGNFIFRKYAITNELGQNVDIGFNLWQSTENPMERQPTIHDWKIDFKDGEYVVYPGINNQDGSLIDLDEIITGDMAAQIDSGIFRFNNLEEAEATLNELQQRESDIVVQARANTLETEPNRVITALSIKGEMPLLNPLEQTILGLMTSHDESLRRGLSTGRSTAEPGDFQKLLDVILDEKTVDVTPEGVGKDSSRPSIQALRYFNNNYVSGIEEYTKEWFDDVARDMSSLLPGGVDAVAIETLRDGYLRAKAGLRNVYEGKELQAKLNELNSEVQLQLEGVIAAGAYIVELEGAKERVSDGTANPNAVSILTKDEAQSASLRSRLDSFASLEDPSMMYDRDGDILNSAVFTSNEALTFINSAMPSLLLNYGDDEDTLYSFFGEYADVVRRTYEIDKENGTFFLKNSVDNSLKRADQDNFYAVGHRHSIGTRVSGEKTLDSVLTEVVVPSLLMPEDSGQMAQLMDLQSQEENLDAPFMQALIVFLENPGMDPSGTASRFAAVDESVSGIKSARTEQIRAMKYNELFSGSNGLLDGTREWLVNKGIDPKILLSLNNENDPAHLAFEEEFARQFKTRLGERYNELATLTARQEGEGPFDIQNFYYGILKDAHSAALESMFDPENGEFIYVNEENRLPFMYRRSDLTPDQFSDIQQAVRTFKAIDDSRTEEEKDRPGDLRDPYKGEAHSRHASMLIQGELGSLVDAITEDSINADPNATLTHALSVWIPDLDARQDRAIRIRNLLDSQFNLDLAIEMGVENEYEKYEEAVAQQDFGLRPDGTEKGPGWRGLIPGPPDENGNPTVMSELSMNFDDVLDGRLIPAIVTTSTDEEIRYMMKHGPNFLNSTEDKDLVDRIKFKAILHAEDRVNRGKSPFLERDRDAEEVLFNDIIRSLSLRDLYFLTEMTAIGMGEAPSMNYAPYKTPSNYHMRNRGEGTFSIVTQDLIMDEMGNSTQAELPFFFPKTLNGKPISFKDWYTPQFRLGG